MQHHALSSKIRLRAKAACIVVLAAITTGVAHRSYAQTQSPVAVRAAYIPVVTWLPAWVAKEKGFFAAHGLDVRSSRSGQGEQENIHQADSVGMTLQDVVVLVEHLPL